MDEITGIAPAISIRQKNSTRNPRSTVATATEIYDYLRLLYARAGHTFCLNCGEEVRKDTLDEIAARVLALPEGRRFYVLYDLAFAPEIGARHGAEGFRARPRKAAKPSAGSDSPGADSLRKRGFNRLYQAGRVFEFSTPEDLLDVDFAKPVYVLVDRLALSPDIRSRLMDSIEICYREGHGEAILQFVPDEGGRRRVSQCRKDWYSTNASIARNAARFIRNPSRGFSRSTIPTAPARAARDSATRSISIWTASFRTKANRWRTARSSRGPSRDTGSWPWT